MNRDEAGRFTGLFHGRWSGWVELVAVYLVGVLVALSIVVMFRSWLAL